MSDHTKGKWEVVDKIKCLNEVITVETLPVMEIKSGKKLISVAVYHNTPGELQANARIISKAPEMLEMLEHFIAICDCHDTVSNNYRINAVNEARSILDEIEGTL